MQGFNIFSKGNQINLLIAIVDPSLNLNSAEIPKKVLASLARWVQSGTIFSLNHPPTKWTFKIDYLEIHLNLW